MQTLGWKSFSSLDGSERTFIERVRAPDANFPSLLRTLAFVLPLGFLFCMLPFAALPILTEAISGLQSSVTHGISAVSSYALTLILYALVLSVLGMYGLRGCVALKLRWFWESFGRTAAQI
jgi:hypothetical protein